MSIVRKIEGREALPVWGLSFVTRWQESPDSLALVLAQRDGFPIRHGLIAYKLVGDHQIIPYHPEEWDTLPAKFQALESHLRATEETHNQLYELWEKESVKKLPGRAFVWLDEFADWFKRTRPYCRGLAVLGEEVRKIPHVEDFDQLSLYADIPPEIADYFREWFLIGESVNSGPAAQEASEKPSVDKWQPAPALRLSQYLRTLEFERNKYRDSLAVRLDRQLEEGLRIVDEEGREARYSGFAPPRKSDKIPAVVDERLPVLYADTLLESDTLEGFSVRLEDVAGYLRANYPFKTHFYWLDQDGRKLSLEVEEHTRAAYIGYLRAEALLTNGASSKPVLR